MASVHCSGNRGTRSFSVFDSLLPSSSSSSIHSPSSRRVCRSQFSSRGLLYQTLLILIIILCVAPVSALIEPVKPIEPGRLAHFARSTSQQSGEPTADHQRSSLSPDRLAPKDEHKDVSQSQASNSASSNASNPTSNSTSTSTSISVVSKSTESFVFPTPFDTLANTFANASCSAFFANFLANSTIMDCHAVSLLLENSVSFFHILSSATETSHVLDIACNAPVTRCADILSSLANDMLKDENCGPDYSQGNSVVQGAYDDMVAYEPLYHATCLTNPVTQNYCFVDAVKNASAPADYNTYFVPLGETLGSHGLVTCNQCLQATMGLFASWATHDDQPLDKSYLPSARALNGQCGAGFVPTNITVGADKVNAGVGLSASLPTTLLVAVFLCGSFIGLV
ncbi:hypothetical protein N7474_009155 [Penicillium riverlandense]|uniref:uncharacterized protein n=1 Tax=Penicillium riverlandense TaxID=1903569 RepID=UPI002547733E|nr:uncharacterized protein N7474_009155 [Penicillium riverlandense]KAJ5807886.1 hypothetical protein N7474_009155 [Penicillium riverlandense]